MFKRILVPLDLSTRNDRALKTARRLALLGKGAKVTLLHVVETIEGIPAAELRPFYAKAERNAAKKLAGALEDLRGHGVPTSLIVMVGHRVDEIVRSAAAERSDLVVIASRKVNMRAPARSLGTISQRVSLLARCAVLLVK